MAIMRISDVVVPEHFTPYIVQNSMVRTDLYKAGVIIRNGEIEAQLTRGGELFNIPNWFDLGDEEANIVSDDPDVEAVPRKIVAGNQKVRKSFLHASWSQANLASELAGDNAINRIRDRAINYWDRQLLKRIVASLNGILASNEAATGSTKGDLVLSIAGAKVADVTEATRFSAEAVIDSVATLGDALGQITAIGVHSDTYRRMMKNDLLETIKDSDGSLIKVFRGMAVIVNDQFPKVAASGTTATDNAASYVSVLFGQAALGYGMVAPLVADGTEIESKPSAGNGGGVQLLHSRVNTAVHPAGFNFTDASVAGASPTLAELAKAANWTRVFERKAIPLAFLRHN